MDTDYRCKQLDVDDEDGLLLLQEQFLRAQSNGQPAAKATRVVRRASTAASKTANPTQHLPAAVDAETAAEQPLNPQRTAGSNQPAQSTAQHDAGTQQTADAQTVAGLPANSQLEETPEAGIAVEAGADDAAEQQPMCPSIPGILREVREREVLATAAPTPRPSAAAFPAAVHRKQSKFALGRHRQQQQQHPQGSPAVPTSDIVPAAAAATAVTEAPIRSMSVAFTIKDSARPSAAAAAAVRPEAAGIHEGNLARLAGMSHDEVEDAQTELAARFTPAALQFLKNRRSKPAAQDQQRGNLGTVQQQQQQQGAGPNSATEQESVQQQLQRQTLQPAAATKPANAIGARGTETSSAAAVCKLDRTTTTTAAAAAAAGIKKGFLGGRTVARPSKQQQQQQPVNASAAMTAAPLQQSHHSAVQQSTQTAPSTSPQPLSPPAAAVKQVPSEPVPPVARLLFNLDSQVLDLADPQTPPTPDEEVLKRDTISRAAGAVPEGYTLPEVSALVRSSHAPQRAAGFRLLAAVLRRAQPSVLHLGSNGQLMPQEVWLDQQQQQQQQQEQRENDQHICNTSTSSSSNSRATGCLWYQVWEYAIVALRAVMLCRIGLDDDNGQVLSAASDALCVLLSRSSSELLVDEVAAATAAVSWPLGLRVSLRRLDQAGAWDQVTGLVKAAAAAQQGLFPAAESADDDADVDTPEDLAAVDPLAGFMATDPLPRVRFLLQNRANSTECVIPLLSVLEAIAASSGAAAEGIVRCRGMPEALMRLLGLPWSNDAAAAAGSTVGHQQGKASSNTSGFRVGVLRLLRLLCAASPLACQLLRTAGLDSAVQLLLCTNGTAAGSGSSSSSSGSSGVEQQLLLLEALRIWRVSALHGVGLSHMDLMFQYIAGLLQPPVPAPAASGRASSTGRQSSGADTAVQLRWCLTAEAYQLVDTLLRHALAVTNSKTLGSEMITPGCAAAIAQEAAAAWLQNPNVLQEVAQGLVGLADCSLPYTLDPNSSTTGFSTAKSASTTAAWFRALPGMHPSLIVPQSFAVLAGFGAVVQYLASYWSSLQSVPRQLAAELSSQLAALGLADSSSSGSTMNGSSSGSTSSTMNCSSSDIRVAPLEAAAGITGGSRDILAAVLLSAPVAPPQQQHQQWLQRLGAAFLQHCVHLLVSANKASTSSSNSSDGVGRQGILSDYALGAAAAATLLAVCQLQQQLQHITQQQHSLQLAAQAVNVVVNSTLAWVSATSRTLVLEPWSLCQHTMRHCQIRLMLKLAKPLLQQQQQQHRLAMRFVDGLFSVLPLLGPGHEAEALQALQLLFGTEAVQQQPVVVPLLAAAAQAVQGLVHQGGPLAAAAAGIRGDHLSPSGDVSDLPYPPRALTSVATSSSDSNNSVDTGVAANWCKVLLEGYAVTWLSIIEQQGSSSGRTAQQQQGSCSSLKPTLPLARVYVSEVEGSRLPVPPEWLMSEILALPHQVSDGSIDGQQQQQQQMHPVSAALLLALGLEILGQATTSSSSSNSSSIECNTNSSSSHSTYMKAVRVPCKLEALLNLLYLFNTAELMPHKRAAAAAGLSPSWQQPGARWAAAVLTQQYVAGFMRFKSTEAAGTGPNDGIAASDHPAAVLLQPQQQGFKPASLLFPTWAAAAAGSQVVDRLVTDLADISVGDPLFSCHVALLLLPEAGVKLQRAVWGSLTHQACLHLLPQPQRCIGGARAYIGVQLPNSSSDQPQSKTGVAGSQTGLRGAGYTSETWFDMNLVGDMAKSLAQGELRKALKMGSLPAHMALHGIAAVALNQSAWKEAPAGSSNRAVSSASMAVNILRGVVRACSVEVLQQLLDAGRTRGLIVSDMSRALVQCAHGDAQLSEKVRQLISLQQ